MFTVSVYNGASFYIGKVIDVHLLLITLWYLDVFSHQYIKSLEFLHEWDHSNTNSHGKTQ